MVNGDFIFHGILCNTPKKSRGTNLIIVPHEIFTLIFLKDQKINLSSAISCSLNCRFLYSFKTILSLLVQNWKNCSSNFAVAGKIVTERRLLKPKFWTPRLIVRYICFLLARHYVISHVFRKWFTDLVFFLTEQASVTEFNENRPNSAEETKTKVLKNIPIIVYS